MDIRNIQRKNNEKPKVLGITKAASMKVVCYSCNEKGHIAKICPKNKN